MNDNFVFSILKKIVVIVLLVFLCSIPFVYAIVLLEMNGSQSTHGYIVTRGIRLFLIAIVGLVVRKKNKKELSGIEAKKKLLMLCILGLICVSICLHVSHIPLKIYIATSHAIGIFDLNRVPLLISVLWEQLFAGDLYWSILLCLTIVFFPSRQF